VTAQREDKPVPPGQRPAMVPGSFELIVVRPQWRWPGEAQGSGRISYTPTATGARPKLLLRSRPACAAHTVRRWLTKAWLVAATEATRPA